MSLHPNDILIFSNICALQCNSTYLLSPWCSKITWCNTKTTLKTIPRFLNEMAHHQISVQISVSISTQCFLALASKEANSDACSPLWAATAHRRHGGRATTNTEVLNCRWNISRVKKEVLIVNCGQTWSVPSYCVIYFMSLRRSVSFFLFLRLLIKSAK